MGIEEQKVQRNKGYRGTVGTEVQRYRGTVAMSTQVFIAVSCVAVVSFGVSVVSMVPVVSFHCFGGFVPVVPFRVLVHDYLMMKQLISDETKLKKTDRKPDKVQRTKFNLLPSTTKKRSPD